MATQSLRPRDSAWGLPPSHGRGTEVQAHGDGPAPGVHPCALVTRPRGPCCWLPSGCPCGFCLVPATSLSLCTRHSTGSRVPPNSLTILLNCVTTRGPQAPPPSPRSPVMTWDPALGTTSLCREDTQAARWPGPAWSHCQTAARPPDSKPSAAPTTGWSLPSPRGGTLPQGGSQDPPAQAAKGHRALVAMATCPAPCPHRGGHP